MANKENPFGSTRCHALGKKQANAMTDSTSRTTIGFIGYYESGVERLSGSVFFAIHSPHGGLCFLLVFLLEV